MNNIDEAIQTLVDRSRDLKDRRWWYANRSDTGAEGVAIMVERIDERIGQINRALELLRGENS